MKKIIIMLCLVAFVFTMAFPVLGASVADEDGFTVTTSLATSNSTGFSFINATTGENVKGTTLSYDTVYKCSIKDSEKYSYIKIYNVDGDSITVGHTSVSEPYRFTQFDVGTTFNMITLDEENVSGAGAEFFFYVEKACDGSTCPATDLNEDNICDDCARPFAVPRVYLPDNWPSAYPTPPAGYETMIVLTENENTWLYMVEELVDPYFVMLDSGGYSMSFPAMSYAQRYQLINDEWAYNSVGTLTSFSFDETLQFKYSTVDIKLPSGELFFPLPLWAEMDKVTQGEMGALGQQVVGTTTILTLCGVGLMACLMALVVFGKLSRIFRH